MKVAIFTEYYYPFISGVVTHIEALKNGLEKKGHEVLIVTTDPKSKIHYVKDNVLYCPAHGVKKIYGYGVTIPHSYRRLKFLKDFNPDVIHIHTEFTIGIFGLWVARKYNKPVVYSLHTMYDEYTFYIAPETLDFVVKPMVYKYLAIIAKRADEITSPSPKGEALLSKGGIYRNVTVIPNPTDAKLFEHDSSFNEKRKEIRDRYGFAENETVLCFCGRLGKEKSIDLLIELFSKCCEENSLYKLLILGDGPEAEYLKDCARETGFGDKIVFAGKIKHDEIAAYYYACDIYATASVTETNSISALEGMACGLMVMQRLDPTNKYQIEHGKNGYIFEDVDDFKKILSDYSALTFDKKLALRKQVATIARQYGPDEFINNILIVYDRAIKNHK